MHCAFSRFRKTISRSAPSKAISLTFFLYRPETSQTKARTTLASDAFEDASLHCVVNSKRMTLSSRNRIYERKDPGSYFPLSLPFYVHFLSILSTRSCSTCQIQIHGRKTKKHTCFSRVFENLEFHSGERKYNPQDSRSQR